MTLIDYKRKWKGELKTCENLSRTSFYSSLYTVLRGVMNYSSGGEKQLAYLALRITRAFIV